MTYSFIKPQIKPLISLFTKIWVLFFTLCMGIIFSIYSFANTKLLVMNTQIAAKKEEIAAFQEGIRQNDSLFDLLTQRKDLSLQIIGEHGSNAQIEKVIKNLFGFVIESGSIRLEHMYMNEDTLELKGITPTKELFALLIQTPLKSIFDECTVSFYPLKNGWFKFTSTNKSAREDNYGK